MGKIGHDHGKSIKNPKVYEALRKKGYSKTKSAKISNAQRHHKKGGHKGGRRGKR